MNSCLFPIATLAAGLTLAHADYTLPFADPPFKINETIVGLEGWEPRLTSSAADGGARLISVRWDDDKPAVLLDSAALKKSFAKTTSDKVKVRLQVAITFPENGAKLQQLRFGIPGAPFREVVFEGGATGGLGFGDGTARNMQTLVPLEDLKPNSYYTITIITDITTSTCDARVTGTKRDGTPLDVAVKDLVFQGKGAPFSSAYIISAPAIRAYLKEFSVSSQ